MSVIVFKEVLDINTSHYVAQWVELDICAQGKTVEKAVYNLRNSIYSQVELEKENEWMPLGTTPKTPEYFREAFDKSEPYDGEIDIFNMTDEDIRICDRETAEWLAEKVIAEFSKK